ncbi:dipeptidase [Salisediminibacterium halotolerans]|uniref:dipeptidase n=1 Tax=Salisediminibacterium halotolerans TaxID=517425 RepID=UPI000EB45E68|nr:dipeptidase [Salisediminibacterium halotolerans]RLJ77864.1 dipeptidase [Actinophytocola xinjiangensis]RPE88798.1 dipeptidase [Salisediminibacterium halotolerans]TWG36841.1 dipeptidase [Salisediminibacterium halotolerans]GEL07978.1 dipeptidase [Salisediminibacterium halotolerans]
MNVIDLHCDVLMKLQDDRSRSFHADQALDVTLQRLFSGNVRVQFFAIFLEPDWPSDMMFQYALEQADLFHEKIVKADERIVHITAWEQIDALKDDEIGAVLTLEGAEAFGNDLMKLRTLFRLGVMSVGLTWNEANFCADGIGEARGGGLTGLGKEAVKLNNANRVLTDVSHLSYQAFWDVIELADYPVATHSNAYAVCGHRRNLDDFQIDALIKKGGWIGIVFNPPFVTEENRAAEINDVIAHIDHIYARGGEDHIAFGSDFDGISSHVFGLEHPGCFPKLVEGLRKRYSDEKIAKFADANVRSLLPHKKTEKQ